MGAIYYWYPKFTGRMMSEQCGLWVAALVFIGFNLTFFPMHLLGLAGMPRRVYTYQPEMGWGDANLFVSLSAVILAAGFVLFFIDVIRSARHGPPAGDNPWDAATLEWATTSPPPCYNFLRIPVVTSADPLWNERGALPVAGGLRVARREIVITTVAEAWPEARESSPRNSIGPFVTSLATTLMLISSIFSPWAVVWGSVPVAVGLVGWFWPAHQQSRRDCRAGAACSLSVADRGRGAMGIDAIARPAAGRADHVDPRRRRLCDGGATVLCDMGAAVG